MREILCERCLLVFRGRVNEWVCPACRKKAVRDGKEQKQKAVRRKRKMPFWRDWEK